MEYEVSGNTQCLIADVLTPFPLTELIKDLFAGNSIVYFHSCDTVDSDI